MNEIRNIYTGRLVSCAAVYQNNKFIIFGSSEAYINIRNFENGTEVCKLPGHEDKIWSIIVTNNNKFAISCGSFTVRVWNLENYSQEFILGEHENIVYSIAFI